MSCCAIFYANEQRTSMNNVFVSKVGRSRSDRQISKKKPKTVMLECVGSVDPTEMKEERTVI
jgi:hypothetical protein